MLSLTECLLLLDKTSDKLEGKELDAAVEENSDAQFFKDDPDIKVVSQVVEQEPAAELANGDADLSRTGKHSLSDAIRLVVPTQECGCTACSLHQAITLPFWWLGSVEFHQKGDTWTIFHCSACAGRCMPNQLSKPNALCCSSTWFSSPFIYLDATDMSIVHERTFLQHAYCRTRLPEFGCKQCLLYDFSTGILATPNRLAVAAEGQHECRVLCRQACHA